MNASSIIVLVIVGIFISLAIGRVVKKGVPCECGGNRNSCGCGCCREHGGREHSASHKEQ